MRSNSGKNTEILDSFFYSNTYAVISVKMVPTCEWDDPRFVEIGRTEEFATVDVEAVIAIFEGVGLDGERALANNIKSKGLKFAKRSFIL